MGKVIGGANTPIFIQNYCNRSRYSKFPDKLKKILGNWHTFGRSQHTYFHEMGVFMGRIDASTFKKCENNLQTFSFISSIILNITKPVIFKIF